MHTIFKIEERAGHYLFTGPYKKVMHAIFVRDGVEGVETAADLSGRKIIIVRGDWFTNIIPTMAKDVEFVFCDDFEEAVKALSLGKGDATVMPSAVGDYLIRSNSLVNIGPVAEVEVPLEERDPRFRLAVRNDWPVFRDILQKVMDSVTHGELNNLNMKWFGKTQKAVGNPPAISLAPSERKFIDTHKPLVFSEINWKPLSIIDSPNAFDGIIADYLNIITERSGLKFDFQASGTWAEVLQKYSDREIEMIPTLAKDFKLGRKILLSDAYVTFPFVIVTGDGVSYIKDTAELNGRRVAVGRKYTSYWLLKKNYPEIELVETDDVEQGLIKLSNGQVFAFVGHMAVTVDHLRRLGLKNLKIAGETEFLYEHGIGVDPKYPEAVSVINKVLASITRSEHMAIYKKWLDVEYEKGIDYSLVWKVAIGAAMFLILVLSWNRKLSVLNRNLNTEIIERRKAETAAESASRAKSMFLATMSHEIRTPMNSVIGFLSLALEDPAVSEKQHGYLATAHNSSQELLGLIDDILDVSKLESGRLELEKIPFNLHSMMRETVRALDIRAKSKNLSLALEIDESVPENIIGDPGRLKQILLNLAGNAIKFTETGGVTIHAALSDNGIHFSVADTGIGIPAEKIDTIFDPFSQEDSSISRKFGGTGLGTTISRQLAELMDGEIWVESGEGKGSVFHFTIRTEPADIVPENFAERFSPDRRRCFDILVVEDIEENMMLAKIRLERLGHRIIEARNGVGAVRAFEREKPDIILMDVHMPEMDGLEATRKIRELEAGKGGSIPIIALTASLMKEEREVCLSAGMDAVAGKPVDFDELSNIMEKLVPEDRGKPKKENTGDAPGSEDMPNLAGIDTGKGLRTWRDAAVYQKALLGFGRDYEHAAEKIRESLENGNREEAGRIVHALKGVSGNLSITDVHEISESLDAHIRENQSDGVKSLVESLEGALSIAAGSIRRLESGAKAESAECEKDDMDPSALEKLFHGMLASFEEYNPKAVEPFIEELGRTLSPEQLDPIKQRVDGFDFDGARDKAVKLAMSLGIDTVDD